MKQSSLFSLQLFVTLSHLISILAELSIKYLQDRIPRLSEPQHYIQNFSFSLRFSSWLVCFWRGGAGALGIRWRMMGRVPSACPMVTPFLQSVYGSTKCLLAVSCSINSNDRTQRWRGAAGHEGSAQGQYFCHGATLPDLTQRSHLARTLLMYRMEKFLQYLGCIFIHSFILSRGVNLRLIRQRFCICWYSICFNLVSSDRYIQKQG